MPRFSVPNTRVIASTGHALTQELEARQRAGSITGCSDTLTQPCFERLLELLRVNALDAPLPAHVERPQSDQDDRVKGEVLHARCTADFRALQRPR